VVKGDRTSVNCPQELGGTVGFGCTRSRSLVSFIFESVLVFPLPADEGQLSLRTLYYNSPFPESVVLILQSGADHLLASQDFVSQKTSSAAFAVTSAPVSSINTNFMFRSESFSFRA
jgi:hypothetical protein